MSILKTTSEKELQRAIDAGLISLAPTLRDFFEQPFGGTSGKVNVILHRRKLRGDFNAVARHLAAGIKNVSDRNFTRADLVQAAADLTGSAQQAAVTIIKDIDMLMNERCKVDLRVIDEDNYRGNNMYNLRHDSNVTLYHFDGGDQTRGRILIPYTAPTTEGITPDDCVRFVDIPKFQKDLIGRHGHDTLDPDELANLKKSSLANYHLPKPGAVPYAFRAGDIFRHACRDNKAGVTPHLHRAPPIAAGSGPRMVLVADSLLAL